MHLIHYPPLCPPAPPPTPCQAFFRFSLLLNVNTSPQINPKMVHPLPLAGFQKLLLLIKLTECSSPSPPPSSTTSSTLLSLLFMGHKFVCGGMMIMISLQTNPTPCYTHTVTRRARRDSWFLLNCFSFE